VHRTKSSGLRVGAAMDHLIECPAPVRTRSRAYGDGGLVTVATVLQPGQKLRVVKFVAYGWSGGRSLPAVRDQVWAAEGRSAGRGHPGGLRLGAARRLAAHGIAAHAPGATCWAAPRPEVSTPDTGNGSISPGLCDAASPGPARP
jgi:hypothetical protein